MSPALKRYILEAALPEKLRAPKCWLPDLIHSQMASGNYARLTRDAIATAQRDKREHDVTLYRNMLDQIADYWAEREQ